MPFWQVLKFNNHCCLCACQAAAQKTQLWDLECRVLPCITFYLGSWLCLLTVSFFTKLCICMPFIGIIAEWSQWRETSKEIYTVPLTSLKLGFLLHFLFTCVSYCCPQIFSIKEHGNEPQEFLEADHLTYSEFLVLNSEFLIPNRQVFINPDLLTIYSS